MSIKRIVLTGGPCSGKTSAIEFVKNHFINQGYMVFIISEGATELINNGIAPFGDNQISRYLFEKFVFKFQFSREKLYEEYIDEIETEEPKIIIYDRGGMDYKAFLNDDEAFKIMNEENMDEANILTRYDIVIYLKSVASGLIGNYTLENNGARSENIEEARFLDVRTLEVWKNHPNLKIVGIYNTFEEKANAIIEHIETELVKDNFFSTKKCKKYSYQKENL